MRAEENVECVPCYERDGDQEPEECEVGCCVGPA